jgi:hypothetical protein
MKNIPPFQKETSFIDGQNYPYQQSTTKFGQHEHDDGFRV